LTIITIGYLLCVRVGHTYSMAKKKSASRQYNRRSPIQNIPQLSWNPEVDNRGGGI